GADLVLEVALRRLRRHVDTGAGDVELPAVVDAAQAVLLVAPEEHGGAAVRTGVRDQADLTRSRAEPDEVLAEDAHALGRAVRRGQLAGDEHRDPVLAHEVAHRRPGPNLTED